MAQTSNQATAVIMHDRETHVVVGADTTLAVGDTLPVIRGNGPREGEQMGTATVTDFRDDGSPVLEVVVGR